MEIIDLSMSFADQVLFTDIRWNVGERDRVALVGPNGAGKSTLLKIIAGKLQPSSGKVILPKDTTVGYLPQDVMKFTGNTLWDEVLGSRKDILEMEHRMREMERRMGEDLTADGMEKLVRRYGNLQEEFERAGGYQVESDVARILNGLGFRESRWQDETHLFSGGWQVRIALARLLLQQPDLLLLDEPTNYLDLENITWLEEYINTYPGGVIMVSHDRSFMNNTVSRVAEIDQESLFEYRGNYDKYLRERAFRREQIIEQAKAQVKRIEEIESFIKRFRYNASKASLVQSRVKQLEKMPRVVIPRERKTIRIRFPEPPRSGRIVAEGHRLEKRYGDLEVFAGVDFSIERGDKVALVGLNGAGKSTLIKILAGRVEPTGGTVRLGHNVEAQYFAQDNADALLQSDRTVLQEVEAECADTWRSHVRDLLGAFLFSGDEVDKPVRVLSGGEKSRVGLAKVLSHQSNLLLLDEPTNHLDIQARGILADAIDAYAGTMLFVSHDRFFLEKVATKVFEIDHGVLTVYPGNYEEYRWYKNELARESAAS